MLRLVAAGSAVVVCLVIGAACGGSSAGTSQGAPTVPSTGGQPLRTHFTFAQKVVLRAHVDAVKKSSARVGVAWEACPSGETECIDHGYHQSGLHGAIRDLRSELEKAQAGVIGPCRTYSEALQQLLTQMDELMANFHNDIQHANSTAIAADRAQYQEWARAWDRTSPRFEQTCD